MIKISESIASGILSGGSQAERQSSQHRTWNRSWERFFKLCLNDLMPYLARHFPNLNHADAEDVLITSVMKTYRSLKTSFDPATDKMEAWVFRDLRGKALDRLRHKKVLGITDTFDAPVGGEDGLVLHEVLGAEDRAFDAAEEAEVKADRQSVADVILETLVRIGKCNAEKISIYRAIMNGGEPVEIATKFNKNRSYVDSLKNEMNSRLAYITARIGEGVPIEDAARASKAKNPN